MHKTTPYRSLEADRLHIRMYETAQDLGKDAAAFVAGKLKTAVRQKGYANLILATGASQFSFLDAFRADPSLDWSAIRVFHLDEYVGLSDRHPASFRKYLRERILDEVKPAEAHFLEGDAADPEAEARRYEALLRRNPTDVACIGIGENGHIAFNDPAVADFKDPRWVKIAELDEACRNQQVGEGWFKTIGDVPRTALTVTVPGILQSRTVSCVVPDLRKADAAFKTVRGPVETSCPASILRTHPDAVLFLDTHSASRLAP